MRLLMFEADANLVPDSNHSTRGVISPSLNRGRAARWRDTV